MPLSVLDGCVVDEGLNLRAGCAKSMAGDKHKPGFNYAQINLQHSKAGSLSLIQRLMSKLHTKPCLCLIQEPWVYGSKICGLNGSGNLFYHTGNNLAPRACIITSPGVELTPLMEFCDRDVAAGLTTWKNVGQIAVASVYMDGNLQCPPLKMRKLVAHCESKGLPLLIGCDANAHHICWGSTDCNERGLELLDYLAGTSLQVLNKGHEPTFVTKARSEVLDLTLASADLVHTCVDWWVDREESSSDHRYIRARFNVGPPPPVFTRNRRATKVAIFHDTLCSNMQGVSIDTETTEKLDSSVGALTDAIMGAYEVACPLRQVKPRRKKIPWWTKELTGLRKRARKLQRTAKEDDNHWETYRQARAQYHAALQLAKRKSWRSYTENLEGCSPVSRLVKILRNDSRIQLGCLDKGSGVYTESLSESAHWLLEQNFPGDPLRSNWSNSHEESSESADDIVTESKIRDAIRSFGPYKAAGSDGVFPALLQWGLDLILPALKSIYCGCLTLGFMPSSWRTMRVIFLPKPGKDSYERASSWRPISLTSFLLKTLEKLIDVQLRSSTLVERLKLNHQFAYLSGISTEDALHNVVARIERSLGARESTVGVFLDIKGAFNEAPFHVLFSGLKRHNVSILCRNFIWQMLISRSVEFLAHGQTFARRVERGCPQGGVLSPLLWNLVVDELLAELSNKFPGVYSQGYADDVVCLSSGMDLGVVRDMAQQALSWAGRWSRRVGLSLNDKLSVVIFTNKHKINIKPISLEGVQVGYSDSCTYLGVTLDSKLNWRLHCERRARKATVSLMQCRRAIGSTWGLSPKASLWIYTAVVRPAIEYAAVVWLPASEKFFCNRIRRVQGLGLRMVTGALPTTPIAALENMLGVLPIHIRLQQVALQSYLRLRVRGHWLYWIGYGRGLKRSTHIEMCVKLAQKIPELNFPYDCKLHPLPNARSFTTRAVGRAEWDIVYGDHSKFPGIVCFTDGSGVKSGSGAAFLFGENGTFLDGASGMVSLGRHATVFQAEQIGVLSACNFMLEHPRQAQECHFFVDNKGVLDSLNSGYRVSGLTLEVFRALEQLSEHYLVTLHWIPSHSGLWGNEEVDSLAKRAAGVDCCGPEPIIPVSQCVGTMAIRQWARKQHRVYWNNLQDCKMSKLALPCPYEGLSGACLRLSRHEMRLATFAITGHCSLNGHLNKMGLVESPICTMCWEDDDTMAHLLTDCPAFSALRFEFFQSPTLGTEEIWEFSLKNILGFLRRSSRFSSLIAGGSRGDPAQ